ncbi:catalase family protein [Variovorax boronicumulans]|uniref:catalase family protein n=1 Tax=Variovorax boronicumulans TaxID=436515 RepID=UPI0033909D53
MNTSTLSATPVRYDPAVETFRDDEAQTHTDLVATLADMATTMADHTGHAMRAVHAKSHGLLHGELRVLDGLPEALAQGLFAAPRRCPVVMRLSTPPAEALDDRVSLPRGMAVKVLGTEGARVEGSEGHSSQDFLFVDGPVFAAPDAKGFLRSLKLLASTTDKAPNAKRVLSSVLQGVEKAVETFGAQSGTLIALGGHAETHPLGATFFTQVPLRYGAYIAKLQLVPVSPALLALENAPLDLAGRPDGTREAVADFMQQNPAVWELRAQLCMDLERMPVEDASVEWPQELSPFVAVARITLDKQDGWSDALAREIDDGMAFNPWHALAAHRPLGNVMRARKAAYAASSNFRSERNGCPLHR